MQSFKRKAFRPVFVLLLQCIVCLTVIAQTEPTITQPLLGSAGKVKKDSISFVSDNTYFSNASPYAPILQTYFIRNMVSAGIEEDNINYIQTDFSVTITLRITKYNNTHTQLSETDHEFTINYKKADTARYNAIQYLPFENAYEVKVKILQIDSGSITWPVSKVLRVDNMLTATRDYVFDCSALISGLAVDLDELSQELTAYWQDPHAGQTEYDLEWAWIDESAIDDYKNGGSFIPEKIFDNNATRVTVSSQSYNIPLMYDGEGRLFVRVRPAQIKYNGQRIEGSWTWQNSSTPVYYTFGGHENDLNWQSSTSFAEEGKRKTVVQYFDGTLRNRQTVTKDNSTNSTVVAESFYDYQGRAVIQILPAPTLSNIIQYSENFNRAISHEGYPKWVYDKLEPNAGICGNPATALSTLTGSAKYYSPNSDELSGAPGKFIPASTGSNDTIAFPLSETRFTADGRLAAQGGVGHNYQLGSNHETKYFYEPPAQEELDALFGTDAGVASHFIKNLVKDANGQYSVSYADMHGRTIATALVADSPLQLDTLLSKNKRNFTKQLIDDETNRVTGRSIISSKSLVVPMTGRYEFHYELNPEQLKLITCTANDSICYDCLYKLNITITADCNETPGFPYTVIDSNFTIGASLTDPICNENGKTTGYFNKVFVITSMPEGAYTITKTLSLSDSAQQIYRDSVFMKNDTCKTFQDFYDEEYAILLSKTNCNITCESCKTAIGNDFAAFRLKFLQQSQMSEPLPPELVVSLEASYKDAMANCERICNADNDNGMDVIGSIKQAMLLDVTPPFGQYAKTEATELTTNPFNIFRDIPGSTKPYKKPFIYTVGTPIAGTYLNEFGQAELNPDPRTMTIENFSSNFNSSWAEQMLYYHPEFCKLKATLENLPLTYKFEATLLKTNTWQEAKTAQYITVVSSIINIVNKDPFFSGPGSALKSDMISKMADFGTMTSNPACSTSSTSHPTMWQLSQAAVFCINEATSACDPNSAQNQCFLNTSALPPVNPSSGCATDWDMAWKHFRSLYLSYRKQLISRYLKTTAVCNPDNDYTITTNQYKIRFMDFEHVSPSDFDAGDLKDFFDLLMNGDPAALAEAHALELKAYDSTCRGYADSWLMQLQECAAIATRWETLSLKTADSIWLVAKLVEICKKGSDPYHPLGSSSMKPSASSIIDGGHTYRNFPDVIKVFLADNGITPVSSTCHPYLITSPKPYDKQPVMTNSYAITKPTECECLRLTTLKAEYALESFNGTFSAWLAWRHGTTISQSALDTLSSLCAGTYPCIFLVNPIKIPPVLQCRGTETDPPKTCIDCSDYGALRDSFYVKFAEHAPILNPGSDAEVNLNIAFQNFANNQTGFSKTWIEWAAFGNTCDSMPVNPCTSLDSVFALYQLAANPNVDVALCQAFFTQFFNNAFQVSYTFEQWVNMFIESCGHRPEVCKARLTCSGLKSYINQFYDIYSVQIYKNSNSTFLFTSFINNKLGTHYTYQQIEDLYAYLCGVSCPLDIAVFPNCYLLTKAYDKFRAEDMHPMDWATDSCQIRFKKFFTGYFGADTTTWSINAIWDSYLTCFGAGCGPDIRFLCAPSYSCATLYDVVVKYYSFYGHSIDSIANCVDSFTVYFNTRMTTGYSWPQIQELYLLTCGKDLDICTPQIDCPDLQVVYNDFILTATSDSTDCDSLFTVFFNTHFSTGYTYEEIANLYLNTCGSFAGLCNLWNPDPVNCGAITGVLADFITLYPEPTSQLGGNCQAVFAAYFNERFGTQYSYEEIRQLYYNVCTIELNVCEIDCQKYIDFANDFNTRYGDLKLPLELKKEFFAYLFSHQFYVFAEDGGIGTEPIPGTVGGTVLTYSEVLGIIGDCIPGVIVTGAETESTSDCEVLYSLKQAFYIMHPNITAGECETEFVNWFNLNTGERFSNYAQISAWYDSICAPGAGIICHTDAEKEIVIDDNAQMMITHPPLLCGLNDPIFTPIFPNDDPCKDLPKIAYNAAMEKWELYLDSLRNVFDTAYYNKCMAAKNLESFTVNYDVSEYHYTLYYYDQAGNLVQTVPPAGVDTRHADATFLANVKTKRQNVKNGQAESSNNLVPDHVLITRYRYNTLNQVVAQKTPDAGASEFWYDRLGRLVVSQNAKQAVAGKYSYTTYDDLGRITQVGQKPQSTAMTQTISRDKDQLTAWLSNNGATTNAQNKQEITRTVYDVNYFDGEGTLSPQPLLQQHLRNRVSYTQVFDTEPTGSNDTKYAGTHRAATYYSYDIHGNVDTLLQDYNSGMMQSTGNRYKKLVYDYDLISGKVNKVSYQPGYTDEFYHRYTYDPENRITDVEDSHDGWIWERDARYSYYRHGPLARTILGQQQVQGLDYAYTLQGWLKGVNSTTVGDGSFDMGGDGKAAGINANIARDVFGFSLNYFAGEYKPIGGTDPFAAIAAPTPVSTAGQDLFNGNISSMAVNIPKLGDAHLYRYRYDQLNRVVAMNAFTGLNSSTNVWTPSATDNYKERTSYDPNGNILSYLRNGTTAGSGAQTMDNMTYEYNMTSGKPDNNKLRHVKDAVSSANYSDDIDDQVNDNYTYDQIGNLVTDTSEGITNITWNVYGKIQQITKTGTTISYSYDASGNRISKAVTTGGVTKTTNYVRDASGNTMSIYEKASSSAPVMQGEVHLYGSSRLGVYNINRDVSSIGEVDHLGIISTFIRGNKFFELSNHLGNVLATISDKTNEVDGDANGIVDYYTADIKSANDYYPFGMGMPGRKFTQSNSSYRYGFNGKENDNEIKGEGNQQDYGMRIYDPRLGRFLSVDPITKEYPELTPYQFASNTPIMAVDLDGLEAYISINNDRFLKGIQTSLKVNDIEEAERQVWAAVHSKTKSGTKAASFSPDPNKNTGFEVHDSKGNIIFSQSDNLVYLTTKKAWPKGGKDWYILQRNDFRIKNINNTISEINKKINSLKNDIKKVDDDYNTYAQAVDDANAGDPSSGASLGKVVHNGFDQVKRDQFQKEIDKLDSQKEILKTEIKTLEKEKKEVIETNKNIEAQKTNSN